MTVGRHREAIFRKFEYTEVNFFNVFQCISDVIHEFNFHLQRGQAQPLRFLEKPGADPLEVAGTTSGAETEVLPQRDQGEEEQEVVVKPAVVRLP